MKANKSQIGIEYLIIVGLVTFVVMSLMLIAFFYSNASRDNMKINQANGFAMKIIAASESTFYSGEPSKATITTYLPDGVKSVEILENSVVLTIETYSGITRSSFKSKVPIEGSLSSTAGIKKVKIQANQKGITITDA